MNTTQIGKLSEQVAVDLIASHGLVVIARNWRTRWCEIDIVARDRNRVIHIIEVRYRRSSAQGSAVASITAAKQRQLIHASRRWMMLHGAPFGIQVDVVGITGLSPNLQFEYIANAIADY